MSVTEPAAGERALIAAAAAGDERAFAEIIALHEGALRAHCYRMLGSLQDAEDALQEAMLRAWRGLAGFEGRSSLRSWLYSIVTNAALDLARVRARRELPVSFGTEVGPGGDMGEPVREPIWLEPFPDRLLAGTPARSPEARYEQRESVELAFVVALQGLPPLQRAVFILREVLGFSAAEISGQLGTSVASVTSALQRARGRIQPGLPASSQQSVLRALGDDRLRAMATRYADALERGDADTLISMLTADATWSMPPVPTFFAGHQRIREFLVNSPLARKWKHTAVRSNGQLAVACYLYDPRAGGHVPAVIDVLTISGEQISAVTAFLTPDVTGRRPDGHELSGAELFARFGLPASPGPA